MLPDSVSLACAAVLFAACIAGWQLAAPLKAPARLPLRFAAVLLSALAVAAGLRMGDVAALLLLPLAAAALMLVALARFARPAGLCIIAAALQTLVFAATLSGIALLAMGLCFLEVGVGAGVLLFAAASLIGLARPQLLRSTSSAWRGAHLP
jgi:hypothetical protein